MDDEQRLAKAHMEWEAQSRSPVWPVPGVYALYQRGELKYIGQSRDCPDRVHHHRHHGLGQRSRRPEGRAWLEAKPGWEKGMDFTARVLPTPQLTGGGGTDDERERKRLESYWIDRLRPPSTCTDCRDNGRSPGRSGENRGIRAGGVGCRVRLGRRGNGPSPGGRRGGARGCREEQGGGSVPAHGPVRAEASADG